MQKLFNATLWTVEMSSTENVQESSNDGNCGSKWKDDFVPIIKWEAAALFIDAGNIFNVIEDIFECNSIDNMCLKERIESLAASIEHKLIFRYLAKRSKTVKWKFWPNPF